MDMEFITGRTVVSTKETGTKTKSTVTASITGKMAEYTMDTGLKTICKAKALINGRMEEYMRVNI